MSACLNCCGSVMLTIASGNEFQSFIVRGKKQFLLACIVLKALLFRCREWRLVGWRRFATGNDR